MPTYTKPGVRQSPEANAVARATLVDSRHGLKLKVDRASDVPVLARLTVSALLRHIGPEYFAYLSRGYDFYPQAKAEICPGGEYVFWAHAAKADERRAKAARWQALTAKPTPAPAQKPAPAPKARRANTKSRGTATTPNPAKKPILIF